MGRKRDAYVEIGWDTWGRSESKVDRGTGFLVGLFENLIANRLRLWNSTLFRGKNLDCWPVRLSWGQGSNISSIAVCEVFERIRVPSLFDLRTDSSLVEGGSHYRRDWIGGERDGIGFLRRRGNSPLWNRLWTDFFRDPYPAPLSKELQRTLPSLWNRS